MNILVAEDDLPTRKVVSVLVEQMGHEVIEAADGAEAWNLLSTRRDLPIVVADRMMPGMSGDALIRRIRSADTPYYIYVLLLTAKNAPDDIVDGLEGGADDYLVKPFNPRELQARIAIGVRLVEMERSLRETRDHLTHLATYDPLTEVYNRHAITQYAERALQEAADYQHPASVILLDIDHFKRVNDRYGHLVGDDALRLIATTLRVALGAQYAVGRWGGEEFLIVLPNTTASAAYHIAETVRDAVRQTTLVLPDGSELQLSASLGIADMLNDGRTPLDHLIKRADDALYRAKREGRNSIAQEVMPVS